ncbi:MAG: hypothetical protein KatS3mg121_0052 [Gammaproteobacteria bacterium]|nr:MAG: hypothetical protein KatS3mg121_0052 [Gammaproteobacteria bacterium]
MIERLVVAGVGLIGGSLALAARRSGACARTVGWGRDAERLAAAVRAGVIDEGHTDPAAALAGAGLIVLAVPLGACRAVFEALRPHRPADAVVTDVGSVKTSVIEDARAVFGAVPPWFVPGHPIAGDARSGFGAARADLFHGRRVVLTPLPETDAGALARVEALWTAVGAEVERCTAEEHDRVLADTSHLPHLLAYALVEHLLRRHGRERAFRFAAGGFRDFSRIAASDPTMWRDICLANRPALRAALGSYRALLAELDAALDAADGAALYEWFARAKAARERFCDRGER